MKIIGRVNHGFILEAHEDEVAKLIGYRYISSTEVKSMALGIGDEINISAIYTQLADLALMPHRLSEMKSILGKVRDSLDLVDPVKVNAGIEK